MRDLFRSGAVHLTRRRFLYKVGATTFGVAAAGAVGRAPSALAAEPCTGPMGSGRCASSNCSYSTCKSSAGCSAYAACGGGTCWRSAPGANSFCCDCKCTQSGRTFYCYCFGRG
jgi:hypothetical protein